MDVRTVGLGAEVCKMGIETGFTKLGVSDFTMRQHSSKQMYTKLLLRHNKSKTLAHIELIPLASPAESSKIRTTCAARLSNIFHLFSNTTPEQGR